MAKENPLKIVSPKFRGSYCNLMKPRKQNEESEPEYGMLIVLDKDADGTDEFIAGLKKRMKLAMVEKLGKEIPFEKCKHFPIADGDDDADEHPEHANCWLVRTKNKRQPGILVMESDGTRRAVENDGEIYSGAWYHASVVPYAWSNSFGKGISISLNGVLKVDDGEKFGGSSFDESDFDDVPAPKRKAKKSEDDEIPRKKKRPVDDEPPF